MSTFATCRLPIFLKIRRTFPKQFNDRYLFEIDINVNGTTNGLPPTWFNVINCLIRRVDMYCSRSSTKCSGKEERRSSVCVHSAWILPYYKLYFLVSITSFFYVNNGPYMTAVINSKKIKGSAFKIQNPGMFFCDMKNVLDPENIVL